MKTQFYIRGLKENPNLRHRLQKPLEQLEAHIPISAAVVIVEHDLNNAPAFRAYALIAVPGPDIHADARDCTLDAVWLKVTAALRKQIEQRRSRREARVKNNGQVRARDAQPAKSLISR